MLQFYINVSASTTCGSRVSLSQVRSGLHLLPGCRTNSTPLRVARSGIQTVQGLREQLIGLSQSRCDNARAARAVSASVDTSQGILLVLLFESTAQTLRTFLHRLTVQVKPERLKPLRLRDAMLRSWRHRKGGDGCGSRRRWPWYVDGEPRLGCASIRRGGDRAPRQ